MTQNSGEPDLLSKLYCVTEKLMDDEDVSMSLRKKYVLRHIYSDECYPECYGLDAFVFSDIEAAAKYLQALKNSTNYTITEQL